MLGDVVRELREARQWTQAELARRLGLNQSQVNRLEGGKSKNPTQSTLQSLADVFELPLPAFMVLIGAGDAAPPSELNNMIADAEFKQLSRLWPSLSPMARRLTLKIIQDVAQVTRDVAEAEEEQASPPEYIGHFPANNKGR